jgi:hypothetical protein
MNELKYFTGTLGELLNQEFMKKVSKLEFNRKIIINRDEQESLEEIDLKNLIQEKDSKELEKYYDYSVFDNVVNVSDDLEIFLFIILTKYEIGIDKKNLAPHSNFYADVYNHAVIVNNNLQAFKRKNDTKPSAKFNIESIIVTKLYLANEEYPVLRISWLWDDDHDIEFLEISPINPTVKNVFELIELQTQLEKNYSLNTNHKCLNKILE